MRCDTTDFIQRYVYYFGVWEPNLSAWLARRLVPGDTFIDVGANVGYFTLLASQAVGATGCVIAVEPEARIRELLERNLALNEVANVRVLSTAATDIERELVIEFGGDHDMGTTRTMTSDGSGARATVRGRPLYDLLSDRERSAVRLVKIDVEGGEFDVLHGLHLERPGFRDDIEVVVEVAPDRLAARSQTAESLLERMRALGFHAYTLANDYRVRAYLHEQPIEVPVRLRTPLTGQTDVVFSRADCATL